MVWLGDNTPPAVRWRFHSAIYSTDDKSPGDNPPRGAMIYYYLKEKAKLITLDILGANGEVIRSLTSKKEEKEEEDEDEDPDAHDAEKAAVLPLGPGVQRIVWDLRHKGADIIPAAKIDAGKPKVGPLVVPGRYKLRLTVDGNTMPIGTVEVTPDPRVRLSLPDYADQVKVQLDVRDDLSKLANTVERLRSLKKQLLARNDVLKDVAKAKNLIEQATKLVGKLDTLEEKLHNPKAEVAYDILAQKGGAKLYSQLATVYDWLGDSDGPVTQGMKEVYGDHHKDLERLLSEWRQILADDVAPLNRLALSLDLPSVFVLPEPDAAKKP